MNTLKKTISIVFITALFLVIGFFLFSLLPIQGNVKIKIVKSGSMEPAIKTGAVVFIKPSNSYKVGDIITFGEDSKDSIPTTHRIVSYSDDDGDVSYNTKGDANEEADPNEVDESDVIGKVLFSIPYAGYILDFARQPVGFVSLIIVPAILVVLYEIIVIIDEVKKIKNKKERHEEDI